MIHHDTHFGNMKVISVCNLCFKPNGTHSHVCPKRYAAGQWHPTKNGVAPDYYPDGKYLVQTSSGQLAAVYINNDHEDGVPYVTVSFDDDTREIDPREIVRIARITED